MAKDDVSVILTRGAGNGISAWSYGYFPTNWGKYRVIYSVRAKLVDVDRGAVLAEAFCSRLPELDATAPSHDELLANEAARLKQELAKAASECAGRFKREMLSL